MKPEVVTPSGIALPDPDQGTLFCRIELEYPGSYVDVWETFDDEGEPGGHNLIGLLVRWESWRKSEQPYFLVREPRFGHPAAVPRCAIEHVRRFCLVYHRREDTRAGVVTPGMFGGGVRRLPDGSIEIQVPVGAVA